MRVAIYARVSKEIQSNESQIAVLDAYAKERGFTVVGHYIDIVTGNMKKRERAKAHTRYDDLMLDAENKYFDCVLVWKYDRFARSVLHLTAALEKFRELKIDFISHTEKIDTTTAIGKFFFHTVASFAELEREMISERTKASLKVIRDTGKNRAGKKVKLGAQERVPQEVKDRIVRHFNADIALRSIAAAEGMPLGTVYSIIKRTVLPCLHGKYRCNATSCRKSRRVSHRPDAGSVDSKMV